MVVRVKCEGERISFCDVSSAEVRVVSLGFP